ncbi:hypothetical protein JZU46_04310 [bacterium]|nr:hypothetical protein [bacterium]
MTADKLSQNGKSGAIQAMPLRKDKINLVSGSYDLSLIFCVIDGNITITWYDDTTSVVALVEGDSFTIDEAKSVTLNVPASSGKFHIV